MLMRVTAGSSSTHTRPNLPSVPARPPHHEICFWCDDIEATVHDLELKSVTFKRPVRDDGWGLTTAIDLPGGVEVMIYQP